MCVNRESEKVGWGVEGWRGAGGCNHLTVLKYSRKSECLYKYLEAGRRRLRGVRALKHWYALFVFLHH